MPFLTQKQIKDNSKKEEIFIIMNPKLKKYEKVIIKLKCRILSYYQEEFINKDPQLEYMLVINNHKIDIKEYNESSSIPYKYGLIISKQGNQLIEFYHNDEFIIHYWKQILAKCSQNSSFFAKYRTVEKIISTNKKTKITKVQSLEDLNIYIAKEIQLDQNSQDKGSIVNEVKIMRSLEHPNLIQLHEVYKTPDSIVIIMEYLKGGDLLKRLETCKYYEEHKAALLMKNLLEALTYLEQKTLVHKDIKPSNILLVETENDTKIKLADFDMASYHNGKMLNSMCGTPGYMAPEIFKKENITHKTDIYSCGLVLFQILTGEPPFIGDSVESIFDENYKNNINFEHPRWKRISDEGKKFAKSLLSKSPKDRLISSQALKSNWIKKFCPAVKSLAGTTHDISETSISEIKKLSLDNKESTIIQRNLSMFASIENIQSLNNRKISGFCLISPSSPYYNGINDQKTHDNLKDLLQKSSTPMLADFDEDENDPITSAKDNKLLNIKILVREFTKKNMVDLNRLCSQKKI